MGNRKSNLIDRQSKFCLFEVEKRIAVVEDIDIVCQALGEQITVYRTGIQVLDGLQQTTICLVEKGHSKKRV